MGDEYKDFGRGMVVEEERHSARSGTPSVA